MASIAIGNGFSELFQITGSEDAFPKWTGCKQPAILYIFPAFEVT